MVKYVKTNVYKVMDLKGNRSGYLALLSGKCIFSNEKRFFSSDLRSLASDIWNKYEYAIFYPGRDYELNIVTDEKSSKPIPYKLGQKIVRIDTSEKSSLETFFQDLFFSAIAHKWG